MAEALYHEAYKDRWRERLFYQYKMYVDSISRLHSREHLSLTIFVFINGFLMVSTLVSLGAEALVKIPWLDIPYTVMGVVLSIGFVFYTVYIHGKNKQLLQNVREVERDLPQSLLVLASPTNIVVRIIQALVPWFFIAAYTYIYVSMHVVGV